MSLVLITTNNRPYITCGVVTCTYLKVQVQVHSHFNWWRNSNATPRLQSNLLLVVRSFIRSFTQLNSTRQKFFSFNFPSSPLLFSSPPLPVVAQKSIRKRGTRKYKCGDWYVHDLLGTAELSPKEMCGEDGRPQESGLVVFTEYNQSRLQSSE